MSDFARSRASATTAAASGSSSGARRRPPAPAFDSGTAASAAAATATSVAAASSPSSVEASNAAAFYRAFFAPLAFYRQLDLRLSSDVAGSGCFLPRALRYGAAEDSAARRRRSSADFQSSRSQRKHRTADAASSLLPSARPRRAHYISPSDLLGVKQAVAASAASASSSTTQLPLSAVQFDQRRVSKRLRVRLEQVRFHAFAAAAPTQPPATATSAAAAASSSSTAPRAAILSTMHYQHLHSSAPASLHAAAHLCVENTASHAQLQSHSQPQQRGSVEAFLSSRLDKGPLGALNGHSGVEFVATATDTEATAAVPAADFVFHAVNFFTHAEAASATSLRRTHTHDDANGAFPSPWTLRILFSPWNASQHDKAVNKGARAHAASSSNNPAFSSASGTATAAGANPVGEVASPATPDALSPCAFPTLTPGSFMLVVPLLRWHPRAGCMQWQESGLVHADIVTLAQAPAGSSAAAHHTSALASSSSSVASREAIVGSCSVRLEWLYKQHDSLPAASSRVPRLLSPAKAAPLPTPILLAWRYVYPAPPALLAEQAASKPAADFFTSHNSLPSTSATCAGFTWQTEYRLNFDCAFCSVRGASSSSSSSSAQHPARAARVLLHSFQHLLRHLDACHSTLLQFQHSLPRRVPMGPPQGVGPTGWALGAAESAAAASSSSTAEQREVLVYEIEVRPRERAERLLPLVVPPLLAASTSSAQGKEQMLRDVFDMEGLPPAFVAGLADAATAAASSSPAHASATSLSASLLAEHTPQSFFCFLGERYTRHNMDAPEVSSVLATGVGRKKHSHQRGENNGAAAAAAAAVAAQRAPPASPTVRSLMRNAANFARRRAQQEAAAATAAAPSSARSRSKASPSDAAASSSSSSPAAAPGPAALSLPAAAVLTSLPALVTRQWYHASTGAPLLLSELGYDSDAHPEEEWLITSQRERIEEFEDISSGEKEFMQIWNEYAARRATEASLAATRASSGGTTGAHPPPPPPPPLYADYMYPSFCSDFAVVCAPLLAKRHLRTALLCHLMSSWEFGLLAFGEIECIMRRMDAAAAAAAEEEEMKDDSKMSSGAHTATAAALLRATATRLFGSVHAPMRGGSWRSAHDAAGGMLPRERGSSGVPASALPPVHSGGHHHRAHSPSSASAASSSHAHRSFSPPASNPKSARLREREANDAQALKDASKSSRAHKRKKGAASSAPSRSRRTTAGSSSSGSGSDADDDDEDDADGHPASKRARRLSSSSVSSKAPHRTAREDCEQKDATSAIADRAIKRLRAAMATGSSGSAAKKRAAPASDSDEHDEEEHVVSHAAARKQAPLVVAQRVRPAAAAAVAAPSPKRCTRSPVPPTSSSSDAYDSEDAEGVAVPVPSAIRRHGGATHTHGH